MKTEDFKRGMQIIYYGGLIGDPGFVTGINSKFVFCRFWSKSNYGALRTTANSEACNPNNLKRVGEEVPQQIIKAWLKYLEY